MSTRDQAKKLKVGILKDVSLEVLESRIIELEFNPNQPRDPKGSETGGQWMKKNDTYYHGSSAEAAKYILKNGIKPSSGGKGLGEKGYSYLANTESGAAYWGEYHIEEVGINPNTTDVVVFEINIPSSMKLDTDPDSKLDFRIKGEIPPEWILGYKIYKYDGNHYVELSGINKKSYYATIIVKK